MNDLNSSESSLLSTLGKKVLNTNSSSKKNTSKEYSLSDVNNFIGSDRKLIVNDSYEFWVHDAVLIRSSNYFKELLETKTKSPTKEEECKMGDNTIIKTYIDIPHPEFFFDILTWLYSKDSSRLIFAADESESFLSMLSLGIFLQLSDTFFNAILKEGEIELDEKVISFPLWSRFCFTFEVLVTLIDLMPKNKFLLRIKALLSWLKEDNTLSSQDEENLVNEKELELLTSKEFFLVKNYIEKNKLLHQISFEELFIIKEEFPKLIPVLDIDYLCDTYLNNSNVKIVCEVCGRKGTNIQDFINNKCEVKLYHPKAFVSLQRKLVSTKCEHEGCKKKVSINEYPCCHKPAHVEGCLMSDGNHILIISKKDF